ncbi:protein cordon-bleu isoform X2 [Festucalex cinctus]
MKARAPPPPPAPRHIFTNSVADASGILGMESKENMMRATVDFELTLPQGYRAYVTEDGSKPLMDLLVDLCSRYHLNPALHILELLSPEGHSLGFKPNLLLGSLNVACVLIKEKACEEKVARRLAPQVPEKTVRLMVNYHGTQKAVLRVNPLLPLQALIPAICEKCEFDPTSVQLLKDRVSRQKLPLDQSLTQLGIKELYAHGQSLVLQPKMASSTSSLSNSESIYSSTNSLDKSARKGLLGFFQLGRRRSKGETTSLGMDDTNDKIIQNEDHRAVLSTVQAVPNKDDQPSTLVQSHSGMSASKMSPKCDTKKRRAPAPPPGAMTSSMAHSHLESYQMGSGSESQQRKRRAPAPPSNAVSTTPDPNDASTPATRAPDSQASDKHSPAFRTKISQSTPISSITVETVKPQSLEIKGQPPSAFTVVPISASPTLSSRSTANSQVLQDSSSELSHSPDSDLDTDDTASHYSTLTSSTSRTASGSVHTKPSTDRSSTKLNELDKVSNRMGKLESRPASTELSRTEDEVESNRHSTIGTNDHPAPPKPRRSPAWEHPTLSTPPLFSPSLEPTESSAPQSTMEEEETSSPSRLHSVKRIGASAQAPETETAEAETLSLGTSSSGSSLPDQGYAASEGMVDGEDSGLVSSPSDIHPTSPDERFFLEPSFGARRGRLPGPIRDISSDSDEGCATWGSRSGPHSQSKSQSKSGNKINTFEKKYKWLHQKSMEEDLSVDMNVPVTAIDEVPVLEDYKPLIEVKKPKVLTGMKLTDQNGSASAEEWRNKNNNACTAASTKKSCIMNANPDQYMTTQENGSSGYTKQKKNEDMKMDSQRRLAVKPCKTEEHSKNMTQTLSSDLMTDNTHCLHEEDTVLPPTSQRSLSTEKVDNVFYQNNSNSNTLPKKVPCSPTSRLGMKTFTVVPPKPSVMQGGAQNASATLTTGAIKIDEQGNIMKMSGYHNRVVDTTESGISRSEECPLVGKAKAFWSCSERQECALPCSAGVTDKAKGSLDNIKSTHSAGTTLTTDGQEHLKTQHAVMNTADNASPKGPGRKNSTVNSVMKNELQAMMSRDISVLERMKQSQPTSDIPHFLRQTRRTSSQYVASAINRYNPMTSTKQQKIMSLPSQSSSVTPNVTFHSLGHSMQVNPRQSSKISLTDNMSNKAGLHHPGPVRSKSYPGYVTESQKETGHEEGNCDESVKETYSLGPVLDRIKHFQSSAPSQTEYDIREVNRCPSPSTSHRPHPQSTAKPLTDADLTDAAKPELSHTMSDRQTAGPSRTTSDRQTPGAPPVNIFGPVKKFKPVVCRNVEKDTSLHSNLMQAIQAGGKDILKKTSPSGNRSMKEAPIDENERSALLSAIRAQSNTGRLKKTTSGAAAELESFRSASKEDQRRDVPCSPSPISLTCTSSFFATSPPPSMLAPPPYPPLLLRQSKPTPVDHLNANALMNPAVAREAMMEAIRSGSAAEKLKKVAVPTKTVQVNGRLGTMHESFSNLP